MKLHLKATEANGVHTKFTVFMNGAYCGQLVLREDEATFFHDLIIHSTWALPSDDIRTSGKWIYRQIDCTSATNIGHELICSNEDCDNFDKSCEKLTCDLYREWEGE